MPAMKPAITGSGTKRMKRPRRKWPSRKKKSPVASVETPSVHSSVVKTAVSPAAAGIRPGMLAATTASVASGTSCVCATTPGTELESAVTAARTAVDSRATPMPTGSRPGMDSPKMKVASEMEKKAARKPESAPDNRTVVSQPNAVGRPAGTAVSLTLFPPAASAVSPRARRRL